MTVSQLIEQLRQMPPHHFVVVAQRSRMTEMDGESIHEAASEVESVEPIGHGVVLIEAE